MACGAFAITATLVGFSAPQRPAKDNLRTAALLAAHAVPAALVLFLLFPRVQGPLWGMPQDAFVGMTGLSETMAPGNLSRLAQSDAIAFRAAFEGNAPAQAMRYWRGPVLWDFDGRTWSTRAVARFGTPRGGEQRYSYSVTLEPHNQYWLFALESAASVPEGSRMSFDGQIFSERQVRNRIRYDLTSVLEPRPEPDEDRATLARALRLPGDINPRARALAADWRAGAANDAQILRQAIIFLQDGRYGYTLEPPLLGLHSVDEFLFETKAGFCEHFSSAFVFLMRAAGVPARVVTGYQGGELNPIDRIITVRQSDAHAWAEVFLRGRGWVRVDPTAASVPGRIEVGLVRTLPQSEQLPMLMQRVEWLRGLRHRWEALAHQWNVWVLGYSPDRQRDFMLALGMRDADWRSLTAVLFTTLGLMTAGLLIWSLQRLVRPDPVLRAWLAFCRKLASRGVERAPHEGPRDYAARAARALPASRRPILRICALYIGLRYGSEPSRGGVSRLRRLVRDLRLA
jgi:transglutaminase-like putative cysteine protease